MTEIYCQGDVCIRKIEPVEVSGRIIESDPDGLVVMARGEVTGHRHGFFGGAVMFRDDGLARDCPPELYLGHLNVGKGGTTILHDASQSSEPANHGPISLGEGSYEVRGQRRQVINPNLENPEERQIARVID